MATTKTKQTISFAIPKEIVNIIKIFKKNNWQIYIVGGAVRDLIIKRTVQDWDLATNATPQDIIDLFPKNSFYNNKFGTVTVVNKKKKIEITTFRSEAGYSDKRHPDKVAWGKTIQEDLSRRDFTINAIAMNYAKDKIELIDPFDGQKDLKKALIRAVKNPEERFSEDALRMLRAIRISSQLGFTIENKTFTAIKKNASAMSKISRERVRDELWKMLQSPFPAEGFIFLKNSQLMPFVIPELEKTYDVAQAKHHIYDVWTHSLEALRHCPSKDPLVRLATLLHDIGKPAAARGTGEERTFHNHEVIGAAIARRIAGRLRLSNKEAERLWRLIRWHQFTVNENQTDKAIRRFIKNIGKENLADILDLRIGDRLGGGARRTSWRLELFKKKLAEVQKQPFSIKDMKVNGKDVMKALSIPPGPRVGQILKLLFTEIEDHKKLNNRRYLLSCIPQVAKKI